MKDLNGEIILKGPMSSQGSSGKGGRRLEADRGGRGQSAQAGS